VSIPISYNPAHAHGERYCSRCNLTPHTIYMYFMLYGSNWYCQFLEQDLKTSLPRKLTFSTAEKVRELAERGSAFTDLASLWHKDKWVSPAMAAFRDLVQSTLTDTPL
jgi:hypothetical protein